MVIKRYSPSSEQLAVMVEKKYPDLRQALITAVDPQSRLWSNPLLSREVREFSLQHARRNTWNRTISVRQRVLLGIVNLMLLSGFAFWHFLVTSRPLWVD